MRIFRKLHIERTLGIGESIEKIQTLSNDRI